MVCTTPPYKINHVNVGFYHVLWNDTQNVQSTKQAPSLCS